MSNGRAQCATKKIYLNSVAAFFHSAISTTTTPVPQPKVRSVSAFLEITDQLFDHLERALRHRHDPMRAIRVMAAGERVLAEYTAQGFHRLEPLRVDLALTVHAAFGMSRRFFIKKALTCSKQEFAKYQQSVREFGWTYSGEAAEDYDAVIAHLDYGKALFADIIERHHRSCGAQG